MRPLLPILFAAMLCAPAASAAPRLDGLPRSPRAGDVVHLTWTGLEHDVREVELELSLDGGHWVRVSPEMDAREGHFDWTVPAWASGIARLRLRSGGELFEKIAVVSEAFAIPATDRMPRLAADTEWWGLHSSGSVRPRTELGFAWELALEPLAERETKPLGDEARPPRIQAPSPQLANDRDPIADRAPQTRTPLHLPLRI